MPGMCYSLEKSMKFKYDNSNSVCAKRINFSVNGIRTTNLLGKKVAVPLMQHFKINLKYGKILKVKTIQNNRNT